MILTLLKIYPTIPTRDCQRTSHTWSQNAAETTTDNSGSEDTEVLRQTGTTVFAVHRSQRHRRATLEEGGRIFFFKCFVCKFNEECFTGSPLRGLAGNFKQPLDSTSLSFELVRPDLRRRNDVLS